MDYTEFLEEGKTFHQIAKKSIAKNKFSDEIIYNFITLAAEKLLVAVFMANQKKMPANHSFLGLLEELKASGLNIHEDIVKGVLFIDSFQSICELESFQTSIPKRHEIIHMLDILDELENINIY